MKFLFRWAFRCFLVLVVLAVALLLLKDVLLKALAENRISAYTGMDARIGRLELGLLEPKLTLENLKLFNSADFGGSPFVDMPELHLEWHPATVLSGKVRFRLARVSLAEVNIVEAKNGETNVVRLLGRVAPATPARSGPGSYGSGFAFGGIDTLNLTIGKLRHTSLKHPGRSTEYQVNLRNEIVTNVRSTAELTNVVMKALLRKGITIAETPAERPKPRPAPMRR
jgi:hypothetical protein